MVHVSLSDAEQKLLVDLVESPVYGILELRGKMKRMFQRYTMEIIKVAFLLMILGQGIQSVKTCESGSTQSSRSA